LLFQVSLVLPGEQALHVDATMAQRLEKRNRVRFAGPAPGAAGKPVRVAGIGDGKGGLDQQVGRARSKACIVSLGLFWRLH
jgi:hypothetical protein